MVVGGWWGNTYTLIHYPAREHYRDSRQRLDRAVGAGRRAGLAGKPPCLECKGEP